MVHRELYKLLNEISLTDQSNVNSNLISEMEFLAYDLGELIEYQLKNNNILTINGFSSDFNHYENLVSIDFQISELETIYININEKSVVFGFSQKVISKHLRTDLNSKYNSIRKRYFESFNITRLVTGYKEINSEYAVSLRQLNSRDFMDYSTFVLMNAVTLSNSIRALNEELALSIAV